jgi:hypothetical protein
MVSQGTEVQFSEGPRDFPRLQTAPTISGAHLISDIALQVMSSTVIFALPAYVYSLDALLTGKTDIHCTAGRVGPRAGLDGCGKSLDHRTVRLVASRYTD